MLYELAERYDLDVRNMVVIGDALTDIQAGQGAGCETILVLTGRGREQLQRAAEVGTTGFMVASDLPAAVSLALQCLQPANSTPALVSQVYDSLPSDGLSAVGSSTVLLDR